MAEMYSLGSPKSSDGPPQKKFKLDEEGEHLEEFLDEQRELKLTSVGGVDDDGGGGGILEMEVFLIPSPPPTIQAVDSDDTTTATEGSSSGSNKVGEDMVVAAADDDGRRRVDSDSTPPENKEKAPVKEWEARQEDSDSDSGSGSDLESEDSWGYGEWDWSDIDKSDPQWKRKVRERLCPSNWSSEEELHCPEGVDKMDKDLWSKYIHEIESSGGFDIKHYPGFCDAVTIIPILDFKDSPEDYPELKPMTEMAIEDFNQQNKANYVVDEILTVNVWGGMYDTYYITFQAIANKKEKEEEKKNDPSAPPQDAQPEPDEEDVKIFQAKVWDKICPDSIEVLFCRLKPLQASD